MPKFQKVTYTINENLLCALINDDYSGLNESEELNLNYFTTNLANTYDQFHFSFDDSEESFFANCEILNLMGDCITLKVLYINQKEFN
jgi:hypothetical protein